MIDLNDDIKRGRLLKAISNSRTALEPFRKVRKGLVEDYAGSWYSPSIKKPKTLVNLINQTARIYTVALASHNPQVLVSSPRTENYAFARRFEVNLNKLISDMALDQTFQAIVLDAFFCLGCAVVMMRDTDTRFHGLLESEEDVWLDPGEPWLNRVSLDDLILDMPAKELSKMRYCGHRYRADFEKVMDEPGYSKAAKEKLYSSHRQHMDSVGATRDIGSDHGQAQDDDLKDMIWLQDVWIAENRSVVTMAVEGDSGVLIEREWKGSQAGPYKFLSLGIVPDNLIPSSPAMNLKGMNDMQNRLYRRIEKDSDAHRIVNVYSPMGADDAKNIKSEERNGWVRSNNPQDVRQVEVGGVDQRDLAVATYMQEVFDRMAGNLQAMGGLGPQASTVGQEELVMGQLSRTEADMRTNVVTFAAETLLDLGRLMWDDQTLELQTSMEVGTSGIEVDSSWTADYRMGNFEDYEFRVEPFSMVFKTPQQKLQETFQVLHEVAPLWPMFQAAGYTVDVEALLDDIARLMNKPELKRIIALMIPPEMMAAAEGGGGETRQSPVTTRETVRKNISTGGTKENRSNALVRDLMGGSSSSVNGQTKSAMGRRPA